MKTIEELEKALEELAKAQEELAKAQEELAKEIAERKAPIWEPKGGNWFITTIGDTIQGTSETTTRLYGVEFNSKEQAEEAQKAFRRYHLLYQLALELNDGWTPDWSNPRQSKWAIRKDYNLKTLEVAKWNYLDYPGTIYFKDRETTENAIKIIQSGALD